MRAIKIISSSLGVISVIFGVLKFVNPFKEWVSIQIEQSGLPPIALPLVITGEIITGLLFLLPFIVASAFSRYRLLLLTIASIIWISMMMAATYVHLQQNVPAEVLPLKIKAPYIPLVFVLTAVINLFLLKKYHKNYV